MLAWLTASASAQDASTSAGELTIPGLPKAPPPPAVVDTVNLFREHGNLRTRVDAKLGKLAADTDVDLWLVTTSFQTLSSPAQEAAEVIAAWSGDRPAIVVIHVRGNHGTGVAANERFQEIVPSFELAATLPPSATGNSTSNSSTPPSTEARVTDLVTTIDRICALVRRYVDAQGRSANEEANPGVPSGPTASDPRGPEALLYVTVLAIAALIVWFTARTTR